MEFSLFKGAVWQLVKQMDWIAISILIGLFCLSVLCVAIMAFKYSIFRQQRALFKALQSRLKNVKNFSELIAVSKEYKDGLGGKLLLRCLADLRHILDINSKKKQVANEQAEAEAPVLLEPKHIESIEMTVDQSINRLLLEEEAYLPVLSISAAAGPLIGLFGTIWGLIHAFVDISQEKSADIATVAPGMAEALIVTLAGLIVAIPALVAYHYFSNELRKFELTLYEIGDKFLNVIKLNFTK